MTKYYLFFLLPLTILSTKSMSQTLPANVLQKSLNVMSKHTELQYKVKLINKNMFSENDTSYTKATETLSFARQRIDMDINNGKSVLRELLRAGTLYNIDLKDSVYSVDTVAKQASNSLQTLKNIITHELNNKKAKLYLRRDTVIDKAKCYTIWINAYDSTENGQHNFTYRYIYINKTTFFPVLAKEYGAGTVDKSGYSLGRLNIFNQSHFYGYRFNPKLAPSWFNFNPTGLNIRNTKMLSNGSVAPETKVKDLNGVVINPAFFKNKVTLLEFGSTICPANPLANPVLNNLMKMYNSSALVIAGIYYQETPAQIKSYIKANNIKFPIYLGNSQLTKRFQTLGTPNFYLIDREGKIVKGFNGYSDQLEKQIMEELDKLQIAKISRQ